MAAPRQVVIDDTDSQIRYFGQNWFQDHGSQDGFGNFGPTYKKTSHGTNGNDSVSFSFVGTSVKIWGTTHLAKIDNGTRFDPSLECFIDKTSIGARDPFEFAENNWVLCERSGLDDGPHEITINITTTGNTFWLDYITYTPSASASYEQAVLRVENTDADLLYGAGWGALGGTANQTTVKGAQAKLDFVGTSVTWVGFIPTEYAHNAARGSYSIDDGAPVNFNLNGLSADATTTVYNQIFFTTPDLLPAPHTLLVTYNGGAGSSTPLTLDYLLVNNVSLPSTAGATTKGVSTSTSGLSSSPSGSSNSSPSDNNDTTPQTTSDSGTPVGAIVGGVVGGLAFIAILLFIFWWCRRNRATRVQSSAGYLGTGTTPSGPTSVQTSHPGLLSYASNPSMQQLQPEPFMAPQGNRSDVSFTASRSTSPNTYPHNPHAMARSLHTPTHSNGTGLDMSDASGNVLGPIEGGYTLATADHLQPVRKGQAMPLPPTVTTVMHQDSGVRLHQRIEDIPPTYTAS